MHWLPASLADTDWLSIGRLIAEAIIAIIALLSGKAWGANAQRKRSTRS